MHELLEAMVINYRKLYWAVWKVCAIAMPGKYLVHLCTQRAPSKDDRTLFDNEEIEGLCLSDSIDRFVFNVPDETCRLT